MGDRTTVTLEVLTEHKERAEALFSCTSSEDWQSTEGVTNYYYFYEVNYGELDFLPKLEANGIPYSSSWDSGGEYTAGTKSCRFDADGNIIIKEIYDNEVNPSNTGLLRLIDDPEKLREFILEHAEKIKVLPWTDQAANSGFYMACRLIDAKP